MHLDGDLLTMGYQTGWKSRDPELAGVSVVRGWERFGSVAYNHGLFDFATLVRIRLNVKAAHVKAQCYFHIYIYIFAS